MTRKSKREIENELEEIESEGNPSGYPVVDTLAGYLRHSWETVDEENHLYRAEDTGEVCYFDPEAFDAIVSKLDRNQ